MIRPRLRVLQLTGPLDGKRYVVNVYDEYDKLVCFCGPYDAANRDRCLRLFRRAGWTGSAKNRPKRPGIKQNGEGGTANGSNG